MMFLHEPESIAARYCHLTCCEGAMREDQQRLRLIRGTSQRPSATEPTSSVSAAVIAAASSDRPPGDLTVALRASEQRLSALLEDRGRLGRDLHDCVLQSLYAIGLSLEHARRLAPKGPPSSRRASPDHAVDQLNGLIQDIRRMIHGSSTALLRNLTYRLN